MPAHSSHVGSSANLQKQIEGGWRWMGFGVVWWSVVLCSVLPRVYVYILNWQGIQFIYIKYKYWIVLIEKLPAIQTISELERKAGVEVIMYKWPIIFERRFIKYFLIFSSCAGLDCRHAGLSIERSTFWILQSAVSSVKLTYLISNFIIFCESVVCSLPDTDKCSAGINNKGNSICFYIVSWERNGDRNRK